MEIPRLRGVIGGPARSPPDDQEYNDERHEGGIHDDDDIYIMTECLSVCLSVTKNDHFRAERRRREVSHPLGLAGRRPALA